MSLDQFLISANTTDLNYPKIRPTLDLNFARTKTLDPRITFTRSSGGSYVGADGLIKYAGVNEPRFDHDPVTGESLGLLVEESRTNILLHSADLANVAWVKTASTVVANQATAPDGTLSADLIREDTSTSIHVISQGFSLLITNGSFTVFCKAAGRNFCTIYFSGSGQRATVYVNLLNGTITQEFYSSTTKISATVTNAGSGWWKISVSATGVSLSTAAIISSLTGTGTNSGESYLGDGVSGIYVWGAQVEQNTFPTSYIPTTTSAVTRAEDNASITGTNFSSWYNRNESTFYVEGTATRSQNARILTFNDATGGVIFVNQGQPSSSERAIYGPSNIANLYGHPAFNSISVNSRYKAAATIAPGSYTRYSLNGQTTSTAPYLPTNDIVVNTTRLNIGPSAGGGGKGNLISRIMYYPKVLSSSELQALTR